MESKTEYSSHYLQDIVKKLDERSPEEYILSTGKTPSGHIHLGILREIILCDSLRRILESQGKTVQFRLFFDSLDAAKRFPPYIPKAFQKKYLGYPFALMPDPFQSDDDNVVEKTEDNYAEVFGKELTDTFDILGIKVEPVWTNQLYNTDDMKKMIRIGLEQNEKVKETVAKYITASMSDDQKDTYLEQQKTWMAAMVICENCNRTQNKNKDGTVSPNRVLSFSKENDTVSYKCPACDHSGEVSVSSGLVKLNWRLDWPAKWTMYHTTLEPAGKDHCTPGGSYDTGLDLCKEIYGYEGPIPLSYEWLRLGDRDMKTSKGIVFTPSLFLEMADPEIIRMLILQTNPNKHISFRVEEMENYYKEFKRLELIYFDKEEAKDEEEKNTIKFIYPLICAKDVPEKLPVHLPFKILLVLAQLQTILGKDKIYEKVVEYMKEQTGEDLSIDKKEVFRRIDLMENWLKEIKRVLAELNPHDNNDRVFIKKISNKYPIFSIKKDVPESVKEQLKPEQFEALKLFLKKSEPLDKYTNENIKDMMIEIRTELGISAGQFFQAFYRLLIGEKSGPRLGPIMEMLDKEWLKERIESVL